MLTVSLTYKSIRTTINQYSNSCMNILKLFWSISIFYSDKIKSPLPSNLKVGANRVSDIQGLKPVVRSVEATADNRFLRIRLKSPFKISCFTMLIRYFITGFRKVLNVAQNMLSPTQDLDQRLEISSATSNTNIQSNGRIQWVIFEEELMVYNGDWCRHIPEDKQNRR